MRQSVVTGMLVALVGVGGCSANGLGNTYTLKADPAFTPTQLEVVIAAADDWAAHVPDLHITVVVASCNGGGDGEICIHPADHAKVIAEVEEHGTMDGNGVGLLGYTCPHTGEIFLDVLALIGPRPLQQAATHELGHSMGLVHEGPGNIMSPNAGLAALTVTCTDVAQWYSLRHLDAPACSK